ncbi:hypothetical protein MKO06_11945 [Gramella sp. GC03-9]|uniref:Lipoprotein n=1 Tax=Christiangramia oceanisediminis TaxID=2920386 RepID=A0A9X2KYF9_9FLAO|nr:hypothetical protein [Gramella oceanisediminis]MCP9200625.1 hypothetical protein [Gramella oceanisediminis]
MNRFLQFSILVIAFIINSCATTSFKTKIVRPAERTPAAFITTEGMVLDGTSCKSPLRDPRDGTEIILVESIKGLGDYQVPKGRYGVSVDELLRVNCETGEVVGIVTK